MDIEEGHAAVVARECATAAVDEGDPFYIVAAAAKNEHTRVLKHGDTFAVFDQYGELPDAGVSELGVFHQGTRYLSKLSLQSWNGRPMLLSSIVRDGNDVLLVDCTNPDVCRGGKIIVERGTVHLRRSVLLWEGKCHVQVSVRNFGSASVRVPLAWQFAADYVDVFEVRGMQRPQRGRQLEPEFDRQSVWLAYEGLDGVQRRTFLSFAPEPQEISHRQARYVVQVAPGEAETIELVVDCRGLNGDEEEPREVAGSFISALGSLTEHAARGREQACRVWSSHEHFNVWVERATSDLHMMTTETMFGPYPYAGVPWFSTPFGRDAIITALECLWLEPRWAKGVLAFLAATQATEVNAAQDAEPGKILHESRQGEMAALGEIPFARYYGSVDSTPLFVWLAGEYWRRTADLAFMESIWPQIEAALTWMTDFGDVDGDGFIEYARHSSDGLVQQGWKDSHDSIFHADGTMAVGPIALCEVQGYAFAAWEAAAEIAEELGFADRVEGMLERAAKIKRQFDEQFWCEDLGTYALALCGDKQQCRVRTSNVGHCLMTGIVPKEKAARVAAAMFDSHGFSGWGVRTVSASEARYNPMSYHNGSIWPHDNAMVAAGLARYGLTDYVLQIFRGQFEACRHFELHRLPELFCGFGRRPGEPPTLYPVACSPQAWAAGAVFMFLQACLGARVSATEQRISFQHPILPSFLERLHIRNLTVGDASIDLMLLRHDNDVGINILRRTGTVEVALLK